MIDEAELNIEENVEGNKRVLGMGSEKGVGDDTAVTDFLGVKRGLAGSLTGPDECEGIEHTKSEEGVLSDKAKEAEGNVAASMGGITSPSKGRRK